MGRDNPPDASPYRPLVEDDALRLLIIEPSQSPSDPLICTLEYAQLSTYEEDLLESYTALSYVWGDRRTETREITLDGSPLIITASLFSALRCLRDSRKALKLWADAICINQKDLQERTEQVKLMGRIYSAAQHTVIFLGESDDTCVEVFDFIKQSSTLFGSSVDVSQWADKVNCAVAQWKWFERIWILQELVLSRDPWVQYGTTKMKWKTLCSFVFRACLLSNSQTKSLENWDHFSVRLCNMQSTKDAYVSAQVTYDSKTDKEIFWKAILGLLESRRGLGISNPRDMIYAHLAIARSHSAASEKVDFLKQYGLIVDYTRSVRYLYTEVAGALLAEGQDVIDLVEEVDPETRRRDEEQLPSWVPNWTLKVGGAPWPMSIEDSRSTYGKQSTANGLISTPRSEAKGYTCLLHDTEPLGSILAIGDSMDLTGRSHSDIDIAWSTYFPRASKDLTEEENSARRKQTWIDSNMLQAYLDFVGLLEAIQYMSQHDTYLEKTLRDPYNAPFRDNLMGWSEDGMDEVSEAERSRNHPFFVLLLLHMRCFSTLNISKSLADNRDKYIHRFQKRSLCIIRRPHGKPFAWGPCTGLVPTYARPGDEIFVVNRKYEHPVLTFVFRAAEDGDVVLNGGKRYILVGRSYVEVYNHWLLGKRPTWA